MRLERAHEIMVAGEWADQIAQLAPGRLRVAALDRLPGVTPEMLDWWFSNLDRDRYLAFHPVDHLDFAWVRGKEPGAYVGATHRTHQRYGGAGPVMRAEISFVPPADVFDVGQFERRGVGTAICAVVHLLDPGDLPYPAQAARFVHVARRAPYGTELRSCWWLDVTPADDVEHLTVARLRHVHEEFGYLTEFLPRLCGSPRPGKGPLPAP